MKHYTEIVPQKELDRLMELNKEMFHPKTGRQWLELGLNNVFNEYGNGRGVTSLLDSLDLLKKGRGNKKRRLSKKGMEYLVSLKAERMMLERKMPLIHQMHIDLENYKKWLKRKLSNWLG